MREEKRRIIKDKLGELGHVDLHQLPRDMFLAPPPAAAYVVSLIDSCSRLAWAEVVAVGPNVRQMEPGDQVLFNPEDRYEVEVRGEDYIILRERDIHAVAAGRLEEGSTGLYL